MAAVDLHSLPVAHLPVRRLTQLIAGLALYGTSMAMQVRATLGLNPRGTCCTRASACVRR